MPAVYESTRTAFNGLQELWNQLRESTDSVNGRELAPRPNPRPQEYRDDAPSDQDTREEEKKRRRKNDRCLTEFGLEETKPHHLQAEYDPRFKRANIDTGIQALDEQKHLLLQTRNFNHTYLKVPHITTWRIEAGSVPGALKGNSDTRGDPQDYVQYVAGIGRVSGLGRIIEPDYAGHVINALFGGGVLVGWSPYPKEVNITPMSAKTNTVYRTRFEAEIERALVRGRAICARVTLNYGDPDYVHAPFRQSYSFA